MNKPTKMISRLFLTLKFQNPSCHWILLVVLSVTGLQCSESNAQGRFREGYVVMPKGDTTRGLVAFGESTKSNEVCRFKSVKRADVITYTPDDILGYGFINDRVFVSHPLDSTNRKVFFEILVKGHVSLYKYGSMWVSDSTGNLHALKNEPRTTYVDGKKILKYTNQHVAVLNRVFLDCPVLKPGDGITLAERPITGAVEDYNKCKGVNYISYKALKPWVLPMIGVTAGVGRSYLSFVDYPYIVGDVEPYVGAFFGLSFDIAAPRVSERISFHSSLLYSTSTYYNYYESVRYGPTLNYITIQYSEIKLPAGFRINFPSKKTSPYIGTGGSITWMFNTQSSWKTEELKGTTLVKDEVEAVLFKKNQLGLWLGLGVMHRLNKKMEAYAEVRAEYTNGIIPKNIIWFDDARSRILNLQLFIGVRRH